VEQFADPSHAQQTFPITHAIRFAVYTGPTRGSAPLFLCPLFTQDAVMLSRTALRFAVLLTLLASTSTAQEVIAWSNRPPFLDAQTFGARGWNLSHWCRRGAAMQFAP